MTVPIFDFLEGISPGWWLALGIALCAFEMLGPSFYLIWPGLAAITVAVILWLVPGLTAETQVILFAALGIAYTFAGRALVRALGQPKSDEPALNRRAQQLVGRSAVVISVSPPGEAKVEIDGVPWRARFEGRAPEVGSRVTVQSAEGMDLRIVAEKP